MPADDETFDRPSACAVKAETFGESLKRRGEAAKGLEQDLLIEVPLLYGSPGSLEPDGDPGVALARAHREELVRRNSGGVSQASGNSSEITLPFERATEALAILFLLLVLFAG